MLRTARREAAALEDPLLDTLTWIQEGTVHGRVGDWPACAAALGRAADREHLLDPAQTWALRLNLGQAELGIGNTAAAAAHAEAAAEVAAAHDLVDLEFKARHNRAVVAFVEGDLPRALDLMRAADAMDTAVARDRSRLDEADVLLDAGLVDAARSVLRLALDGARRDGHRIEEGDIALRLARCEVLAGDLDAAREHVRRALTAFRSRQAGELVREAELVRATVDVAAGTELPAVVTALARHNSGPLGPSASARAAVRLEAEARVLLGDPDGADRRLRTLAERTPEHSLGAGLHETLVRARIAAARGDEEEAERRALEGNRLLAAHQFQSSSLDVRAAMALHGRELAAFDVARALASGSADGVLTTVERWRAVSHRINPVTTPPDAELAALTRELRRLRRLLSENDGAVAADLRSEIAALEPRIAHREWSLATGPSARAADSSVEASEAGAVARDRGARVVELVESAGTLFAVTVGPGPVRVQRVGTTADVVAHVTRLRRDLRARAGLAATSSMAGPLARATESSLRRLDDLVSVLWDDAGPGGPVVVVPTRVVGGVPWGLLPSLRGRPLTVAPSLTRWVRGTGRGADRGAERTRGSVRALHGPGLTHAGTEVAAVQQSWAATSAASSEGRRASGPEPATSEDVVAALGEATVVHLAAHGTHEAQSPLFSSVRMADGPVFAHEFPRPVAAEHVTLSACDVGQFSSRPGDEPLGLAIALVSLGATSVLAAVAPVADDLSADAMVDYHRRLAAGSDAASAWAAVVEDRPDAGVFCLYGSDWSSAQMKIAGSANSAS